MVTLHARDGELTLLSSARGVRYAVRGANGELQASLDLEQLQAVAPQLYELVQSATARMTLAGRGNGSSLDASLFGSPSEPARASQPRLADDDDRPSPRSH